MKETILPRYRLSRSRVKALRRCLSVLATNRARLQLVLRRGRADRQGGAALLDLMQAQEQELARLLYRSDAAGRDLLTLTVIPRIRAILSLGLSGTWCYRDDPAGCIAAQDLEDAFEDVLAAAEDSPLLCSTVIQMPLALRQQLAALAPRYDALTDYTFSVSVDEKNIA